MSFSSSIQACLELASAFRTSSGFATDSSGGRFDAARTPPSTSDDDDALALMALSRS